MALSYPVNFGERIRSGPPASEAWCIPSMSQPAPAVVLIANWPMASEIVYPHDNRQPLLSLRGLLPDYIGTEPRAMLALEVHDGHPVPHGCFDAAVAWLDAHKAYDPQGAPIVTCWLGQSRSVVFTAAWVAHYNKVSLGEALTHVCSHRDGAYPHVELIRSAYAWRGERLPDELK